MALIGAHVRGDDPVAAATELDAETVQLFLADPQGWKKPVPRADADELAAVRDARTQIAALWDVDRDTAAGVLNEMLTHGGAVPFLARHDSIDWHLHGTAPHAPLGTVMLVETAMAMADVVRSDEYDRLQRCAADDCEAVLVDLSRNRSRRFCDVNGCANRAHGAAYRARRSSAHPGGSGDVGA